ncbi:MAG: hypothetical protein WKH64_06920 [Chloroflexia bacterium]
MSNTIRSAAQHGQVSILAAHPHYWPTNWRPEFRGQRFPGDLTCAERENLERKLDLVGFDGLTPDERHVVELERSFHFCRFGN